MNKLFFLFAFLIATTGNAQIESSEYFSDATNGLLNMIHETIKVDDGIIISGEINVGGLEHPLIMKIDLSGQLLWSTYNTTKIGITGQNSCTGFDIWLSNDGFVYGVSRTYNTTNEIRKIWKVNDTNGDVAFIKTFYLNGYVPVKLCDYDNTKLIATYKKTVNGSENIAMMAYISKQTGDTIKKFQIGTSNGEFGARIDKNKNIYYWRDNTLSKYNRDSLNQLLWTKTYAVINSNQIDEIQDVYIDYQDNVFLFARNGGVGFGLGGGIVAKVSNVDGTQIWNTLMSPIYSYVVKSDFIDRNGKLYISYRHTVVGSVTTYFTAVRLDKITGNQDWITNQLVTPVGTPSGTGDETAILSMDIDCSGDLYATGYYNDANYGPAVWGNMKINGATGAKIFDKTIDNTPPVQDDFSEGLASFIYNNQSIILGQLQNMSSPNFYLSDAYYSAYNSSGDYTVLKRIGAEYSIPSQTLDIQSSGDTLFYLKQQGRYLLTQSYLHRSTQIWNNSYSSATGKISLGGLMKVTPGKVITVYKENPTNTIYPYSQAVSNTIKLLVQNRSNGAQSNLITYTFTNDTITLLEMEADDNAAFVSYEKDGNVYMLRWNGGGSFAAPVLLDLAGSSQSFKGIQNCVINKSATNLLAVDNLHIKQIAKSNLAVTNLFTFPTSREYYDCEIRNNKLYMVGKDQSNHQLYSVYDLTSNSLITDESYEPGAFLQIDHDTYGNSIVSGGSGGNVTTKYINSMYNTVVWEKTYSLGTSDSKTLYSSNVNPFTHVVNQTGSISRPDGSSDFFINTINFYGDSIFTYVAEDLAQLKSFGFVAGYAPDSSSLVGGSHNRHISSREGVIFDLDTSFCNRMISGAQTTCSTPPTALTASSALAYQWTLNGQPISGATNQTLAVSQPGRYNCIFTDACGQDTSVVSFYSDIVGVPAIPAIFSPGASVCANGNMVLTTTPAFHYQWFLNGNIISNSNNDSLTITQPGSYSVIVMNDLGCTASSNSPAVVSQYPAINNAISSNTSLVCSNMSGLLVSNPQNSYQWYHNGQLISGAVNDSLTFNTSGVYNVLVTDLNGCADSLANGIHIGNYPSTTSITGANHLCQNQSQYLVSSPSQSYQWYHNGLLLSGSTNDSLFVDQTGHYNVVVLNNTGCIDSSQTGLNVSILPFNYTISGNGGLLCSGQTQVLTATSGQTAYHWYLNGAQLPNTQNTLSINQEGIYNVQITDVNGCIDTLDTGYLITTPPAIPSSFYTLEDTICSGSSSLIIASAGSSYQWIHNGSTLPGQLNDTLTASYSGTYSVIVTDSYGCTDQPDTPIQLSFYLSSTGITGNTAICNGNSTILTSNPAVNYQWYLNGNALTGETNGNIGVSQAGNYNVHVTDLHGCTDSTTSGFQLNYYPSTTSITGSNHLCQNQSQYLVSSPSQSYQWYHNGLLLSGATNDSLYIDQAGHYNVVVLNNTGCIDSSQTGLNVSILPFNYTISGNGGLLCSGQTQVLTATSGQTAYHWYLNGAQLPNTQNTLSINQEGIYNVQITDVNGCIDTLDTGYLITTPPAIPSSFYTLEDTICSGSSSLIIASAGSSYQWLHNGSTLPGQLNDTLTASYSGTYSVIVTDSYGCNDQPDTPIQLSFYTSTAGVSGNGTICDGSSTILTSNPAASYQWYLNGNTLTGETDMTVDASQAGNYVVHVLDLNGCSDSTANNAFVLDYYPSITSIFGTSNQLCFEQSEYLVSSSSQSYQWYQNGLPLTGEIHDSLYVDEAGQYNVIVLNDLGCIDSSQTVFELQFFSPSTVSFFIADTTLCQNDGIVSLSATPANGGFSGTGVTNSTFDPAASQAGEYYIEYSGLDPNNCYFTDSILFAVFENSTHSIQVDTVGTYTLNGTTYTSSGTYTQTLVNSNGCDSTITLILNIDDAGISESSLHSIQLYPNPSASGIFFIQSDSNEPEEQLIEIYDAKGSLIESFISSDSKITIDLSGNERGVYFVKAFNHHFAAVYQ